MSDPNGHSIASMQSMVLELPPSCIEFCPAHPSYFLVGTYNLQKEEAADGDDASTAPAKQPQSRNGSIVVFRLGQGQATPLQSLPQPSAVFDLHFNPQPGKGDICAAVSSTGTISLFRLAPSDAPLQPLSVLRIQNLPQDTLFTFCAWHPTLPYTLAVTTAGGDVMLARIHDDLGRLDGPDGGALIQQHSLEAWCVAFAPPPLQCSSPPPATVVFSGGDDSALKYTSLDSSTAAAVHAPLTLTGHNAGVTFILPLPLRAGNIVLTGSYDDTLRAYAITPPHETFGARRARLLAASNLGGGVWRLGVVECTEDDDDGRWEATVLASCMHAGTRVVRIRGRREAEGEIQVVARFEEHKSMNYGSDWSRVESKGREVVCISTSFYDRLLCVWKFSTDTQ